MNLLKIAFVLSIVYYRYQNNIINVQINIFLNTWIVCNFNLFIQLGLCLTTFKFYEL